MGSKADSTRSSTPSETALLALELESTEADGADSGRLGRPALGPEEFQRLLDAIGDADREVLEARPVLDGEPFSL